ncbi:MAG TPA: hypothetical protein VGJ75_10740, partial [Dongiaceae bacterium]
MTYHITGLISAVIFLLTVGGLWSQLKFVWQRRRGFSSGERASDRPTAVLSLNQFVSSFLAFYSFLLYGACLPRFNHYLVWPRLVACLLTLMVLFEIRRDGKNRLTTTGFASCLALLLVSPALLLLHPTASAWGRWLSQGLVVVVTVILAQGYPHQVALIRQTGCTGGVSLRMHQFFFLKDVSTIAFALALGFASGWPLLLLSSVSAMTKLATMWHFRWVRLSPLA